MNLVIAITELSTHVSYMTEKTQYLNYTEMKA